MKPISEILDDILDSVQKAARAFSNFVNATGPGAKDYSDEQEELVKYYLDQAFLELEFLLEIQRVPMMLANVRSSHKSAAKDFTKSIKDTYGDPYSYWATWLGKRIRAVRTSLGATSTSQVTKDVVEILQATEYSITDRHCFPGAPRNEHDVHVRIEAVLKCVFTDLRHKPTIGKPIKNFEPDTGLPSVRTLIEYKFVSTEQDVKRVADEVLADTRGYVSKEWSQFVYVIYETRRLKPQRQWADLLLTSGVVSDTHVIVISGEEPPMVVAATKGSGGRRRYGVNSH